MQFCVDVCMAPPKLSPRKLGAVASNRTCFRARVRLNGGGPASDSKGSAWRYVPPTELPLAIRVLPQVVGPLTGHYLRPGEVFCVAQELYLGLEGVVYLKLADGRGWAFDRLPGVGVMCERRPFVPTCSVPNDCGAGTAGAVGASAARASPLAVAVWPQCECDDSLEAQLLDAELERWISDGLAAESQGHGTC